MSMTTTLLPQKFHSAVVKWQETFLPDYDLLMQEWQRFFPKEPQFKLCAYNEMKVCEQIECGEHEGQDKYKKANQMAPDQAAHLLGAIKAQASTEFGSIQQHQLTLTRAQNEQDQFWILRMMAEELRHGYQMLHLLLSDDWTSVSDLSSEDMVEQILSMRTGSHILGAFNVDFDSFCDNIVFCALLDRVGKYQLTMQKSSAYRPMSESMPQMLREEAFHLAAGVVPMRRWMEQAAAGAVYVTVDMLQKVINKWIPRALEAFGHEKGGGRNVRYGLKPLTNGEAMDGYYNEVSKLIDDLNTRYIRAKMPNLTWSQVDDCLRRVVEDGDVVHGIARENLLHMPHRQFYRRRGQYAFELTGFSGESFDNVDDYVTHLVANLPEAYRAGRDFHGYLELLKKVHSGETELKDAVRAMPNLTRVGGTCPCSKSMRWVMDDNTEALQ